MQGQRQPRNLLRSTIDPPRTIALNAVRWCLRGSVLSMGCMLRLKQEGGTDAHLRAEQRPGFANGTQPKPPTALDMRAPAADPILTLQRNNTARWFGVQAVQRSRGRLALDETVGLFCADGRACSLPAFHLLRVGGAGGHCIKHTRGMALPRFARYRPRCPHGETSDSI